MAQLRVRYAKIRQMTETMLAGAGVWRPAVPIADLVSAQGIEIRQGNLGDVSGLILREGRRTVIGLNDAQTIVRRRFTLAHEFGHFLLHQEIASHSDRSFRVRYRDRVSSEATDLDEIEANFFAASILMPRSFLDNCGASETIDDDERVQELAVLFGVSGHAMSLRLVNEYRRHVPY